MVGELYTSLPYTHPYTSIRPSIHSSLYTSLILSLKNQPQWHPYSSQQHGALCVAPPQSNNLGPPSHIHTHAPLPPHPINNPVAHFTSHTSALVCNPSKSSLQSLPLFPAPNITLHTHLNTNHAVLTTPTNHSNPSTQMTPSPPPSKPTKSGPATSPPRTRNSSRTAPKAKPPTSCGSAAATRASPKPPS